jgi:hypothetical protein
MKFYFISISSLSFYPVFKYVLSVFEKFTKSNSIHLVESHISGFPLYNNINTHFYAEFNSMNAFNKMSYIYKIKKYIWACFFLFKAIISKKSLIYTCDYQVLFIAFRILRIINNAKKHILIYHQYELIDEGHKRNVLQKIKLNKKYISLVITPEINRLNYFLKHTDFPIENTCFFPNTCIVNNEKPLKNKILTQFNDNDIIIAHIGNIGFNHFLNEFIKAFNNAKLPDYYKLIFIGKQSDELKKCIKNYSFEQIYFFDEVPHCELSSIYSYIDYGLILYKPIDLNFDYCAPNKLYEYWAHGVPVLAHNLKGLEGLIKEPMGSLVNLYNFKANFFLNIKKLTDEQRNIIKNEFIQNFEVKKFQQKLEYKLKNILS